MQCHRCGRRITRPEYIGGACYGSTCALQIATTSTLKPDAAPRFSPRVRNAILRHLAAQQVDWVEQVTAAELAAISQTEAVVGAQHGHSTN